MIPRIAETIEALNHMELKALKTKTIILEVQCTNQENSRFVFQSRSRHNLIRYGLQSPQRELPELSFPVIYITSVVFIPKFSSEYGAIFRGRSSAYSGF